MKIFYFLLLYFTIISCNNSIDSNYVKSKLWNYERGFRVRPGDFIIFDTTKVFTLNKDTILYREKARAIIKEVDKKNFTMTITSLDGKVGTYTNVEESLY